MSYFKTFKINDHIFQFKDPMGVLTTLIIGKNKAMLIDTAYGIGDLKKQIEEITKLPLIVIDSHGHMDHTGGNYQFNDEQAASGDVEHHGFVPLYNACIEGLLQAGYSTGGCREDVIALEIDVLDNPIDNLVIADLEHVSIGFLEHVEKASCYAVWRFPVGKNLSEYDFCLSAGLIRADRYELPAMGLPGVVHQGEWEIGRAHV